MDLNQNLPKFSQNYFNTGNNEQLSSPEALVSDSTTTTTINTINTSTNNYYHTTFKTPKKTILSIKPSKTIQQQVSSNIPVPNKNIYSKNKILKTMGNTTNNIIINNNTNIINNNNTNIINNNIINSNNDKIDKEYNRSMSQMNMPQMNSVDNARNYNISNNNIRTKHLIFNKRKITQKNYINNISKNHIDNSNNHNYNLTYGNYEDKYNNNLKNLNNPSNKSNNNNNDNQRINNKKEENSAILNVEEILMIEEKLSSLLNCLKDRNPCTEECFECINFYFTTKLSKNLNKYFINDKYLQIIKRVMNLKIFAFIICYDISLNENIFPQYIGILNDIFKVIHRVLILISKYFYNKIIDDNSNIWVKKLHNLIQKYDDIKKSTNIIFEEMTIFCNNLNESLYPLILQKYNKHIIIDIYNKINIISQEELNRLYIENIYINTNLNGSIIPSSAYFEKNKNNQIGFVPVPYLKTIPNKKYTLVLDLDETLIHFKGNPNDDSSGILQFRPFLSEFLSSICRFYELVVFTAATQDYADPIINAIEQKGTTFDHRLYRVHTIIINNDFVKDLSRLGRDLSRVIIVDNMEQNYKLQPDNGITIRPFWGKDVNDMALLDLLTILTKIVKNNMDVRDGISLFKEDIISRVTSNIYRRVQN